QQIKENSEDEDLYKNLKLDENGCAFYKYSKRRKKIETGGLQRESEIRRLRNKKFEYNGKITSIIELEKELSNYNSKSADYNTFIKYVDVKNRLNKILFEKYEDIAFRKQRW